ncbi:MAG: DUF3343 domain-containing protein [Lachnospiraceae bacterium]|nr:DUF3343 domain-containing protein [Lachnospiraceae bacterium]
MLSKQLKLIVTFFTSSEAIATEKACKKAGIDGKLISAPRNITADCGISYAANIEDKMKITELLTSNKIAFEKMVEMEV